ncbi:uncharacterized protein LOC124594010 [Schistocerca americana]|uniref:uncharacterized protein LOC124594010 n=1 Tax=Schistocerca americana TaxID=7009 RepID=UPI001F4F4FC0|nr:uncharacterized protein LOC124594010 [Schistocerca americana]
MEMQLQFPRKCSKGHTSGENERQHQKSLLYHTQSLTIGYGITINTSCPVGPNCPCIKRACPPNQLEKCGMRYRQPQRPRSYKPIRTYCCPLLPMDGCTVYKTSYMKHCTRRTGPIPPRNALCIPQGLFSRETTQQVAFPDCSPNVNLFIILKICLVTCFPKTHLPSSLYPNTFIIWEISRCQSIYANQIAPLVLEELSA